MVRVVWARLIGRTNVDESLKLILDLSVGVRTTRLGCACCTTRSHSLPGRGSRLGRDALIGTVRSGCVCAHGRGSLDLIATGLKPNKINR